MGRCEGIQVELLSKDDDVYKEYVNPNEQRHPDLWGTLGSRRVLATPGSGFAVTVNLLPEFNRYAATGVMIVIVIGDRPMAQQPSENSQAFYLDAAQLDS